MKQFLILSGKVALWAYVVSMSLALLLKALAVFSPSGWWFAEMVNRLSQARPFFLFVILPLAALTLWEVRDWDKLLSARKHV